MVITTVILAAMNYALGIYNVIRRYDLVWVNFGTGVFCTFMAVLIRRNLNNIAKFRAAMDALDERLSRY